MTNNNKQDKRSNPDQQTDEQRRQERDRNEKQQNQQDRGKTQNQEPGSQYEDPAKTRKSA